MKGHLELSLDMYSKAAKAFSSLAENAVRSEVHDPTFIPAIDLFGAAKEMSNVVPHLNLSDCSDDLLLAIFSELYWFRACESLQSLAKRFANSSKLPHIGVLLVSGYRQALFEACKRLPPSQYQSSTQENLRDLHSAQKLLPIYTLDKYDKLRQFYESRYIQGNASSEEMSLLIDYGLTPKDNAPPLMFSISWLSAQIISRARPFIHNFELMIVQKLHIQLLAFAVSWRKTDALQLFNLESCIIPEFPPEFYEE